MLNPTVHQLVLWAMLISALVALLVVQVPIPEWVPAMIAGLAAGQWAPTPHLPGADPVSDGLDGLDEASERMLRRLAEND